MFTHTTCQAGIFALVLCAVPAGCSNGSGATEQPARAANSKPAHPFADIIDLYRAGQPDKARDGARRYAADFLASVNMNARLDTNLGTLQGVTVIVSTVLNCETERSKANGKPMDEESRKAVAPFIEKMERAAKLASDLTAGATLGDRERRVLREMDEWRVSVIKNWVLAHPRDEREAVYRAHQQFLEAHGVKPAGLVDATDTPPEPTADDRLLESAKAESEQIRKAVGAFYRALAAADAKGLRAVVSTTTTDEAMSNVLNRSEAEKKRSEIRRVVSVGLDKARIEPERVSNGQVVVRVSGIVVTLEKAGGTSVTDHTEIFLFVKEKERWLPCFR